MTDGRRLDRESLLDLLRSQHTFPGTYVFRVVVRPHDGTSVVSAVGAALPEGGDVQEVEQHASRGGKYRSLRIHARVPHAESVLDVYEVLSALDGVLMTL